MKKGIVCQGEGLRFLKKPRNLWNHFFEIPACGKQGRQVRNQRAKISFSELSDLNQAGFTKKAHWGIQQEGIGQIWPSYN